MNYVCLDESQVFFECGYSCDNEIFINYENKKFFITDPRYFIEACEKAKDCEVVEARGSLIQKAREILKDLNVREICFDPDEFSVFKFEQLSQKLGINFIQKLGFAKLLRIVKNRQEIEILRKNAKIAHDKFDEFASFIRDFGEGMSEKELYQKAICIFKENDFELSFNPIIAINENAAKAHALPTKKRLKKGDLILLDAGIRGENYCSDCTRVGYFDENFNFSKTQDFKDSFKNEIFKIVLKAQQSAILAVKPGVKASFIDKVARDIISDAGFGNDFFHSTGHGVGIDIHELPIISSKDDTILREGMVFSIEPGIYLKDKFGIRIEDVVVVTDNGCEVL